MRFKEQSKKKALTFSFDDGVTQDIQMIELLNQYNLKGTFNLNSGLLGKNRILFYNLPMGAKHLAHYKIHPDDVRAVYAGHEIAVHGVTHPYLTRLGDAEVFREVEEDRLRLSELAGYEVVGMAYPYNDYDGRVIRILQEQTGVRYSRNTKNSLSFDPQEDLFQIRPTIFVLKDFAELMALGQQFLELETDTPQVFCVWGHSHEMDYYPDSWVHLEEFCKLLSNREDIFYGTNAEIYL